MGDCGLLSAIAAVASKKPEATRQAMADFGDGTFGIRLGDKFYRVDADLPFSYSATSPKYAGLGREDCLWVALLEKAFVVRHVTHRGWTSDYPEYNAAGWWGTSEVYALLGASAVGERLVETWPSKAAFLQDLYRMWRDGWAVSLGFRATPGVPVIPSHAYTLISLTCDAKGNVTSVTVRNPWGVDGTDKPVDPNPNDGSITLSSSQFLRSVAGTVYWGVFPKQTPQRNA